MRFQVQSLVFILMSVLCTAVVRNLLNRSKLILSLQDSFFGFKNWNEKSLSPNHIVFYLIKVYAIIFTCIWIKFHCSGMLPQPWFLHTVIFCISRNIVIYSAWIWYRWRLFIIYLYCSSFSYKFFFLRYIFFRGW